MLGLDAGSDSIGWAAFELAPAGRLTKDDRASPDRRYRPERLLHGGVRLFDSGRDPKKQTSHVKIRGERRRARRPHRAKRWRLQQLRVLLANSGVSGNAPPHENPYALRRAALKRPLTGPEFLTVCEHLCRHRGFKSLSLRTAATKEQKDEINHWEAAEKALRSRMQEEKFETVGVLLANDLEADKPIRRRFNADDVVSPTRKLLIEEFRIIRRRQYEHFNLTDEDWDTLEHIIFDQRPIRPPPAGRCRFFPEESRAAKALPTAQEFIVRQTLANLRVPEGPPGMTRPLITAEFEEARRQLSTTFEMPWPRLRQAIGLKGIKFTIETERSGSKKAARIAPGNMTEALLGPLIPNWSALGITQRDELVNALLARRQNRRVLLAYAVDPLGDLCLDTTAAEQLADIVQFELPRGYLDVSLKLAMRANQFMQPGVKAHEALAAAAGRHHSDFRITSDRKLTRLPYYGEVLTHRVLPGSGDTNDHLHQRAGCLGNVTVHICLNEIAKIVNGLIERYGSPPRLIVVETTRQLKAGEEELRRIRTDQGKRERENELIDNEIAAQFGSATAGLVDKRERRLRWRLRRRQNGRCLYTGAEQDEIGFADAFTAAYSIDHIIPLARGGRDSFENMVLCKAEANAEKGNKTPWEAWHRDRDRMDRILAKVKACGEIPRSQWWRFGPDAAARAEDDGKGYAPRQLVDTSYIGRIAREYLEHVAEEVVATRGGLTARLRDLWNLPKNLLDERRHFVDAAVIAMSSRSLIQRFNTASARGDRLLKTELEVPEPFNGFAQQVRAAYERVWPSRRPDHARGHRPVAGQLHEDTLFGIADTSSGGRLSLRKEPKDLFSDDKNAAEWLSMFRSDRFRERFMAELEVLRRDHPDLGLAELCHRVAASQAWGPRGIGHIAVWQRINPEVCSRFSRGKSTVAAKPGANAYYEIWEVSGRRGSIWRSRVITRFDLAQGKPDGPTSAGERLIMRVTQGDHIVWNGPLGREVGWVKKFAQNGRIFLWPIPWVVSSYVAGQVPHLRIKGDEGIQFNSAEVLRAAGARPATISVLGRLRIRDSG